MRRTHRRTIRRRREQQGESRRKGAAKQRGRSLAPGAEQYVTFQRTEDKVSASD